MVQNYTYCNLSGNAVITKINGTSKANYLRDAKVGDIISFTLPLCASFFARSVGETEIICKNIRTGNVSHYTPNQINRTLAHFELKPLTKEDVI